MQKMDCPICGLKNVRSQVLGLIDGHYIMCSRCGEYKMSFELSTFAKHHLAGLGYILSGLSREIKELGGKAPEFDTQNIKDKIKDPLIPDVKSVEAKSKKLLTRFKEKSDFFGQSILTDHGLDYPLAYAKNIEEYEALIHLLEEKKLVQVIQSSIGPNARTRLSVTAKGWEVSQSTIKESTQAFIASWFDQSTVMSINAMKDAISEAGYEPMCINNEHFPERIMDKALGEIRKSKFVVVDLTGNRGSVFFEAGFAFGLAIESIYVYKKGSVEAGSALEFYVKHYQCYEYENESDLREKLKNIISARLPRK